MSLLSAFRFFNVSTLSTARWQLQVFFFLFFRWLNLLSLDVVLIALAWQEVFARAAAVTLRWEERALLALSIWMIYIIDHWLDAMTEPSSPVDSFSKQSKNLFSRFTEAANNCVASVLASLSIDYTLSRSAPSTPCSSSPSATLKTGSNKAPRHHYVRSHRLLLGLMLVSALMVSCWLLCYLSFYLLIAGMVVAIVTLSYLVANHFFLRRGLWFKGREIVISVIFSLGCALAGLLQAKQPWLLFPWVMAFAVVALINCTLIARMERNVLISALAPQWTFSPRWLCLLSLFLTLLAFFLPSIIGALCCSLLGLSLVPMIGRRFGYEIASLSADQVLFFGALFSFLR
jgi:hypothetical protein